MLDSPTWSRHEETSGRDRGSAANRKKKKERERERESTKKKGREGERAREREKERDRISVSAQVAHKYGRWNSKLRHEDSGRIPTAVSRILLAHVDAFRQVVRNNLSGVLAASDTRTTYPTRSIPSPWFAGTIDSWKSMKNRLRFQWRCNGA